MTAIPWVVSPDGTPGRVWDVVDGCSPASEGCLNCYGATFAATRGKHMARFKGLAKYVNGRGEWSGEVRLREDALDEPLRVRKPTTFFVNSKSDLFHEKVPMEFIARAWATMIQCLELGHRFIVLTKRPERMADFVRYAWVGRAQDRRSRHIWLGVSVENQVRADERIHVLMATPAAVRFVSVEPMLGPVNLYWRSDWLIAGCESGPNRRPAETEWFRWLRDSCAGAGVPFFLKQMEIGGKLVKMPELDGVVWDQYPAAIDAAGRV